MSIDLSRRESLDVTATGVVGWANLSSVHQQPGTSPKEVDEPLMRVRVRVRGMAAGIPLLLMLGGVSLWGSQDLARLRGLAPEDYYSFEFFSDPRLSPDGSRVAYVVTTSDPHSGRSRSSIWIVRTDGAGGPREATPGPWSSATPKWSPDGQILAFLSARPVSSAAVAARANPRQVYLLPLSGGEARRLTDLTNGVTSVAWSLDGSRLAVTGRSGPSDADRSQGQSRVGRHIKRVVYKTPGPVKWLDDRRSHIWVVDVSTGDARQVTDGDWDEHDPQWSPDGSRIAFVSDRTGLSYDARGQNDVYVVSLVTGVVTKVSNHNRTKHPRIPGPSVSDPRWSPDGKRIAYFAAADYESFHSVWLAGVQGDAPPVQIRQDLDTRPSNLQWDDRGWSVYFEANVRGERHLFRADTSTGEVGSVTSGPRTIFDADVGPAAGKIVYMARDFTHINDLYVAKLSGASERRLAGPTARLWQDVRLADVEHIRFKGAGNLDIDGFFVKPLWWKRGTRYPLILVINSGGRMWGKDWEHEFQVYAARGWAVLYTNPRGSTGYGHKFQRAIKGDRAGPAGGISRAEKPSIDVTNGIEAVFKKYPWIDPARVGVTGLSYGGFLTSWLVSHTSLFNAAVAVNAPINHVSQDGTRFRPFPRFADFGGTLWEAYDTYWNSAPLKYAQNVRTPTLILQSEHDFMVPLEQGEQWFRALKYFDVTTEMVVFPGATHFGLNSYAPTLGREPRTVVEALNWRIYWFDRFLNENQSAKPPGVISTAESNTRF